MLRIYCADIKTKLPKIKLPKEVVNHFNKYRNKEFKQISELAWTLLVKLLRQSYGLNLKDGSFAFSKNNKPYLKNKKLFFSISHSLNLIALAISDKDIGVDIERIIPTNIAKTIAYRILNKSELSKYSKLKNKEEYLTEIWTKKESLIKLGDKSILNIDAFTKIKTTKTETIYIKDSKNIPYVLAYTK